MNYLLSVVTKRIWGEGLMDHHLAKLEQIYSINVVCHESTLIGAGCTYRPYCTGNTCNPYVMDHMWKAGKSDLP